MKVLSKNGVKCKIIAFDPSAIGEETQELEGAMLSIRNSEDKGNGIVLDLTKVKTLDPDMISAIERMAQDQTQKRKRIMVSNGPANVNELLTRGSARRSIRTCASVEEALYFIQYPELADNVSLIKVLGNAVVEGLQTTCPTLKVRHLKTILKDDSFDLVTDVCAVQEFKGKSFDGSFALCFPKPSFLKIMGEICGETYGDIGPQIADGAREFVNMITSVARKQMFELGCVIQKDIPVTETGSAIGKLLRSSSYVMVLLFETELGPFHVQIGMAHR